ncbi:MAG TPA: pre-peptidase C-terminal domain-containing protein, partial [Allosphingosinicella sp.]
MARMSKGIFAGTDTDRKFEYLSAGADLYGPGAIGRASLQAQAVAGAGGAAGGPAVAGPVASLGVADGTQPQADEKPVPFALPCITDEKLLILMAQNSVNGRLAAMRATDSPGGALVDDEPAGVAIAVGASVTGFIDFPGDVDDVTVTLVAGQRYMISLMGAGAGALQDSYLELFGPSMGSLGHDDDGAVGRNSVMTLTAAVSGTYTVRASAFGSVGGQAIGQYRLDVLQMGADTVPDTLFGAAPIGEGITFGFRETTGDIDTYKVSLVAGRLYSFSLAAGTDYETTFNPLPAGEIDTILTLRGPTGTVLARNDDISWPSDASSYFEFYATATGDYYLEVGGYSYEAVPGSNSGGYVIDFHEVEVEAPDPLDSLDWTTAGNIPTVMVDGVPTAYIYFAAAGENFGENAVSGDPTQPASGGNGTLLSYGWTAYEKAQFMLAMQEYTKILGIAYVETANSALATFRVITNSSYAYGAYAYPQDPAYGTQRGIMVFNVDNRGWNPDSDDPAVSTDGLGRGGFAWAVILHEAGHAHGLAHPHDTGGGSEVMLGVNSPYSLGLFDLNQQVYTQMSYNDGWQTHPDGSVSGGNPTGFRSDAGWQATLGAFDIAVLQARYGVAPAFATGDN